MSDELTADEKAAMAAMENEAPVVEQQVEKPAEVLTEKPIESEKPVEQPKPEDAEADPEDDELKAEGDTAEEQLRKLTTALNRERRERKKFKAEAKTAAEQLAADKIERARLDERLNQLSQRFAQQPAPVVAPQVSTEPRDPNVVLAEHDKFIADQRQRDEMQVQQQQFASHVVAKVNEFKATTPDYPDAYKYLQDKRIAEMRAMGANDQQIAQTLPQEEFQLAAVALQNGRNPAEVAYQLATARGYAKAAPAAAQQTAPTAAEKLAQIAKGQQNAQTLGAGGAPPASGISLERLAAMSDKDFAAAVSGDVGIEKLRELFGN